MATFILNARAIGKKFADKISIPNFKRFGFNYIRQIRMKLKGKKIPKEIKNKWQLERYKKFKILSMIFGLLTQTSQVTYLSYIFLGINIVKILNTSDQQLKQPQLIPSIKGLLQLEQTMRQINKLWSQKIAFWQHNNLTVIREIVDDIKNGINSQFIYHQSVFRFLVSLCETLMVCNKIKIIKQCASSKVVLIGKRQQFFSEILFTLLNTILTNLFSVQKDELILPFIQQVSKTIKKHPKFLPCYMNIFLTNKMQIQDKLNIIEDFLSLLMNNRNSFIDSQTQCIKILYIIYMNEPLPIRMNRKQLSSTTVNYKVLNILQQFIGISWIKIQQLYVNNPYEKGASQLVYRLCFILSQLTQQQDIILLLLKDYRNIKQFLINRIVQPKEVPQLRSAQMALESLCHIAHTYTYFQQIIISKPILWLKLIRAIDYFGKYPQQKNIQMEYQQKNKCEGQKINVQNFTECQPSSILQLSYLVKLAFLFAIVSYNPDSLQKMINEKIIKKAQNIYYSDKYEFVKSQNKNSLSVQKLKINIRHNCAETISNILLNSFVQISKSSYLKFDNLIESIPQILDQRLIKIFIEQLQVKSPIQRIILNTLCIIFQTIYDKVINRQWDDDYEYQQQETDNWMSLFYVFESAHNQGLQKILKCLFQSSIIKQQGDICEKILDSYNKLCKFQRRVKDNNYNEYFE